MTPEEIAKAAFKYNPEIYAKFLTHDFITDNLKPGSCDYVCKNCYFLVQINFPLDFMIIDYTWYEIEMKPNSLMQILTCNDAIVRSIIQ